MAIDFAKSATSYWDLGANGIGAIISGKQVITVQMHVWIDSLTTNLATDNVILRTWYDATDPQLHIGVNATSGNQLYVSLKPAGETAQVVNSGFGGVISTGQWVSVAVVCDINGDNTIAYVNGSDTTDANAWTATSFSTNSPTDPDALGANGGDYTDTDQHFDGRIAELAIWDRELSSGEITALANHAGAERIGGRPILYLPMLHNAQGTDGVFAKCRYSGLEPTTGGGESLHSTHPPICYPKRHSAAFGIYVPLSYLFQDTFTDSDSTGLDAHTPDTDTEGGGWTESSGTWEIQSNKVELASGSATGNAVADMGVANTVTTVDATLGVVGGTSAAGPICRWQDANNYWVQLANVAAQQNQLWQRAGGSDFLRASASASLSQGSTYSLSLTANGNNFTATIDGGSTVNYTSSTGNTRTINGLRGVQTTGVTSETTFDNFAVEAAT